MILRLMLSIMVVTAVSCKTQECVTYEEYLEHIGTRQAAAELTRVGREKFDVDGGEICFYDTERYQRIDCTYRSDGRGNSYQDCYPVWRTRRVNTMCVPVIQDAEADRLQTLCVESEKRDE